MYGSVIGTETQNWRRRGNEELRESCKRPSNIIEVETWILNLWQKIIMKLTCKTTLWPKIVTSKQTNFKLGSVIEVCVEN